MKIALSLGLALAVLAATGYADTWSGNLLDAACLAKNQQNPNRNSKKTGDPPTCVASKTTGAFALQTSDGKIYKLDPAGNSKAATALRGNPDNDDPEADVSGARVGEILKVESISVR